MTAGDRPPSSVLVAAFLLALLGLPPLVAGILAIAYETLPALLLCGLGAAALAASWFIIRGRPRARTVARIGVKVLVPLVCLGFLVGLPSTSSPVSFFVIVALLVLALFVVLAALDRADSRAFFDARARLR
jgi:hypothetical protein